jgi:hypothetical protein
MTKTEVNQMKHEHEFRTGRSKNVETCFCGRFRFTEKGLKEGGIVEEIKPPVAGIPCANMRDLDRIMRGDL